MLKGVHIILFCTLSASSFYAQPTISYFLVDEAQGILGIFGTFDKVSGEVRIDNQMAQIIAWSDSMITVSLPDSGKGSAGPVEVTTTSGSSVRMLSLFKITLSHPHFYFDPNPHIGGFRHIENRIWYVSWRADINPRPSEADSVINFQAAKSSYGIRSGSYTPIQIPWSDSSASVDSSISLTGRIYLNRRQIVFDTARLNTAPPFKELNATILCLPHAIDFDSTGYLSGSGYSDTTGSYPSYVKIEVKIYDQKLLFPPISNQPYILKRAKAGV